MVHGKNRIPYWIDRRLTGLAGPDYDATISFGLPFESEDSQYGKYRLVKLPVLPLMCTRNPVGGSLSPRSRVVAPIHDFPKGSRLGT